MIIDKLKDWKYYKDKIPLYIQNSFGINEHFKIMFDLLCTLDENEDTLFNYFDILNENPGYKEITNNYAGDGEEGYSFKFLDILGNIYGVTRTFDVEWININNQIERASVRLNNKNMLKFIKGRILQNNWNGTYEETREYYDKMGLPLYIFTGGAGESIVYFQETEEIQSDPDYYALLKSGLLILKSMGITYYVEPVKDVFSVGVWDDPNRVRSWDNAIWS